MGGTDEKFMHDMWSRMVILGNRLDDIVEALHARSQHVETTHPLWLRMFTARHRLTHGVVPLLKMAREQLLLPALDAKADGGTFGAMDAAQQAAEASDRA